MGCIIVCSTIRDEDVYIIITSLQFYKHLVTDRDNCQTVSVYLQS